MTENEAIAAIAAFFDGGSIIGDDCAELDGGFELVSADASCENTHFDLRLMSPSDAMYRCLTSNISDICAMGGMPGPFFLSLCCPTKYFDDNFVLQICEGIQDCLRDHGPECDNCVLSGGDICRSDSLVFAVTITGRKRRRVLRRSGAKPGDYILFSGTPGRSAAGLDCLRQQYKSPEALLAVKAFRRPKAQVNLSRTLAESNVVTSMMDLSDGLQTDLPKLLAASGLTTDRIDLNGYSDPVLDKLGKDLQKNPSEWIIAGGEDFGLLWTSPEEHINDIDAIARETGENIRIVGRCSNNVNFVPPKFKPFRHFDTQL